ncbi:PhoH family protein [Spirochaetia bacterium 38H-sp]|uniref:PhoH-like protein n=1 Tax=Rarispira pelagica TaxID=3141764 RepID=A0ABU9UEF3_9SPIR
MVTDASNGHSVVVSSGDVLSALCGPQDRNLVLFESLLGEPVRCRGNELIVFSNDEFKVDVFKRVVDELIYHIKRGHLPGRHFIESLFDSAFNGRELSILKNVSVAIPGSKSRVFPKSYSQAVYLEAVRRYPMVFSIGPAGTGKTFLAVAMALEELMARRIRKLVLTRPVVEAGERLGFLPGDLAQKINPYLKPLYDAIDALISPEAYQRLEEQRMVEIIPLAYMRGRSLDNSFIILDEAQNTTKEQMKMFLTRLGQNSRAVITGDVTQVDLPDVSRSGLVHAEKILSGIDEICFCYFSRDDVVRHPLVKKIIEAYEREV